MPLDREQQVDPPYLAAIHVAKKSVEYDALCVMRSSTLTETLAIS